MKFVAEAIPLIKYISYLSKITKLCFVIGLSLNSLSQNTAIHLAAIAGHAHIVQYLMSFEELLFMSNGRDKNALDLAIDHGRENVAMVMIEHKR